MKKQQIIVSIPDATGFTALPQELVELFGHIGLVAPTDWTMPGTQAHNSQRLVHFMTRATPGTVEWFLSMLNATAHVGWQVLAAQDWRLERDEEGNVTGGVYRPVPASVLDYIADQYDAEGNLLPRPTGPVPLHTFSGAEQWVWV